MAAATRRTTGRRWVLLASRPASKTPSRAGSAPSTPMRTHPELTPAAVTPTSGSRTLRTAASSPIPPAGRCRGLWKGADDTFGPGPRVVKDGRKECYLDSAAEYVVVPLADSPGDDRDRIDDAQCDVG